MNLMKGVIKTKKKLGEDKPSRSGVVGRCAWPPFLLEIKEV